MAGNYLKAMQLTKQLQKQAEEASKNKDLAETELAAAREQVQSAKGIDAQSSKAEKALAEAEAAYEAKEYKTALDSAQKAKAEAVGAYEKRLRSMIDSVENLNSMSTDIGGSSQSSAQLVKSAKEAMAGGELKKAFEFASKAWEDAEKTIHEHLSESFSKAQLLIMLAKENGQDTSIPEDFLRRARTHLEENALEEAMGAVEECMDSVTSRLEDFVNDSLEETASNIRVAEELEVEPAKAQEILDKARKAVQEGDFEEALSLSKQAGGEVNNAISKRVNDLVKRTRERVQEAVEMGCETEKAQALLDEAKNAAKERSYQQVMDFCKKSAEELDNSQFQQVLKVISDSRSKFIAAKKAGADITNSLELLNEARDALKNGDFKHAMDCAKRGNQSIEGIVETYRKVEEAVVDLDAKLATASKYGVAVDEARVYLERATVEAEGRNFDRAVELVERGRSVLKKEWMSVISANTQRIEEALGTAQKLGIDIDEPLAELTAVTKRAVKGDYSEALGDTEALIARINIHVSKALDSSIAQLNEALGQKASAELQDAFGRVRSLASSNPLSAAKEFVEIREKALSTVKAASSQLIEDLTRTVNLAAEFGADEKALMARIEAMRSAYSADNYSAVMKDGPALAKELEISIFKSIDASFTEAKKAVVEVKKTGADIEDLKEELKKVPPLVKGREYFAASEIIKNVKLMAEDRKGARDKAYDEISHAATAILEAKKAKADIKGATEFLIQAKKAFESGDFVKALSLSGQAVRASSDAVNSAGSLERREKVRNNIDLLLEAGVDVEKLASKLAEVDSFLASSAFDRAKALLDDLARSVHELAVAEAEAILAKCAKAQQDASAIGIDVSAYAKEASEARKALDSGEYSEAFSKSRKALRELERLREGSASAGETLSALQQILREVEHLGIATAKAKEDSDAALKALQAGDFERCASLAQPHLESLLGEAGAKVLATIEGSERLVAQLLADKGVDVPSSAEMLVEARRELEALHFTKAADLAMKAGESAEQVALQKDMASESLRTARNRLDEARKKGMALHDAETVLSGAQKLAAEGSYDAAIKEAIKVGDIVSSGADAFARVQASSAELDSVIKAVEETGGDASVLRENERRLLESAGKGRTDEAVRGMAELMQEAKAVLMSTNSVAISAFEANLSAVQGMGVDSKPLSAALSRAKKALRDQSVDELKDAMAEAKRRWDESMTRHSLGLIADADVKIISAKQKGVDVADAEALRRSASDALDAKDYFKAASIIAGVDPELEFRAKEVAERDAALKVSAERETLRKAAEEEAAKRAAFEATAPKPVEAPTAIPKETTPGPGDAIAKVEDALATVRKFGLKCPDAEKALALAKAKAPSDPVASKNIAERANTLAQAVLESLRPNLSFRLDTPPAELKEGETAEITLTLSNEKKGLAKEIKFNVEGAEGPLEPVERLKGGGTASVRMRVAPRSDGEHSVSVSITYQGILGETPQTTGFVTTFKVAGSKTAVLGQATAAAKCQACMGGIKPGLQVITCQCGASYHKPCGDRAGSCKSCGKKIRY